MFRRRAYVALALASFAGACTLPAAAAPPINVAYSVKPIIKLGDPVGKGGPRAEGGFVVGSLNDNGQLVLDLFSARGDILAQYSNEIVTPIAVPGGEGPQGTWPQSMSLLTPPRMNRQGNVAFAAWDYARNRWLGTFLWNAALRTVTTVGLPGVPVGSDLILTTTMNGGNTAAINNRDEIVFAAHYRSGSSPAIFVQSQDKPLEAVAVPGRSLVNGKRLTIAFFPTINDEGRVGFLGGISGQEGTSALVAEKGTVVPAALLGQTVGGAGRIVDTNAAWVNNMNSNVLVYAMFQDALDGPAGLVLKKGEELVPVAVPGKEMPGGGKFKTLRSTRSLFSVSISDPNDLGQHALLESITEEGRDVIGAYLMDAEGDTSLILKVGSITELGEVRQLGVGVELSRGLSLNNNGQVALPIRISGLPSMVALLTPKPATSPP